VISATTTPANEDDLPSAKLNQVAESHDVTAIIPYSKGFITSCGKGRAFLYEKIDDKEFYRKVRELRIPQDPNSNDPSKAEEQYISCMGISPSEETLLAVTNWQQIYELVFSNIDVGKVEHAEFGFMTYSYHHSGITGIDVCIRKPLIGTCSMDKSVRIWNYETG